MLVITTRITDIMLNGFHVGKRTGGGWGPQAGRGEFAYTPSRIFPQFWAKPVVAENTGSGGIIPSFRHGLTPQIEAS